MRPGLVMCLEGPWAAMNADRWSDAEPREVLHIHTEYETKEEEKEEEERKQENV